MSDSAEEEVFEVEEIQAHKFVKKNKVSPGCHGTEHSSHYMDTK